MLGGVYGSGIKLLGGKFTLCQELVEVLLVDAQGERKYQTALSELSFTLMRVRIQEVNFKELVARQDFDC